MRCLKCAHVDNADFNAARVLKKRGIALLVEGKVVVKQKKTARVRGKDKTNIVESTVGLVQPEPGSLSCPTPVENMSDALGSLAANAATFVESGNRHLNASGR